MSKPQTNPTLYNEVLQLSISNLKRWGYIVPERIVSGAVNWSKNGNLTGSISIVVNNQSDQQYIELDYNYKNEPINYKISLQSLPSNLNRGEIWYFVCPITNKLCRKLYSICGHFYHREAFNGCMYETQTKSKKYREQERIIGAFFKSDELYRELSKKHFKKYYSGIPTNKYLKIIRKIQQAENVPLHEIEKAILS